VSGTALPPGEVSAAAALLPTIVPLLRRDITSKSTTIFPCEIRDDTPDLNDLRKVIRRASMEDLSVDVFSGNNGFAWTVLGRRLAERGFRIINYPSNVRLPSEAPPYEGERLVDPRGASVAPSQLSGVFDYGTRDAFPAGRVFRRRS
jgi:hypothetical protein